MIRRVPGLVLLAALGGLAVWLWQADLPAPRATTSPPRSVFTQAQIERAMDYREPQYLLVLVALSRPRRRLAWPGGGGCAPA